MTFDLVTDWFNWKQWSGVGFYNWHHFIFIFKATFLFVASVGTALCIIETITISVKLYWIHKMENTKDENPSDSPGRQKNDTDKQESRFDETTKEGEELKLGGVRVSVDDTTDKEIVETGKSLGKMAYSIEEQKIINDGISKITERRRHDDKEQDTKLENMKKIKGEEKNIDTRQKNVYRLTISILILTGLLEDFPVVIMNFATVSLPTCGAPARQEAGSLLTMITIISSMLNSLWIMIILFCELCWCNKLSCLWEKDIYSRITFETWDLGHDTRKIYGQRSNNYYFSNYCLKRCVIILGGILLFVFIFLLFSGNFLLGLITIGLINGSGSIYLTETISLSLEGFHLRQFVTADLFLGPGLDQKRDEAMFINIQMKLPQPYQVVLLDEDYVVTTKSTWTNHIINRLYIGQFEELSHLKDGTLTKAIPCSRVFPFVNKVEESLFLWDDVLMSATNIDFSQCKLIFTLRYYPANTDPSPFEDLPYLVFPFITIEWGIHIQNDSICPSGVQSLSISEVLTKEVENDVIHYTCKSACGDNANICDNAHHARFQSDKQGSGDLVQMVTDLYLAINDLKVADSCAFIAYFNKTSKFCDKYWDNIETVQIPTEI